MCVFVSLLDRGKNRSFLIFVEVARLGLVAKGPRFATKLFATTRLQADP